MKRLVRSEEELKLKLHIATLQRQFYEMQNSKNPTQNPRISSENPTKTNTSQKQNYRLVIHLICIKILLITKQIFNVCIILIPRQSVTVNLRGLFVIQLPLFSQSKSIPLDSEFGKCKEDDYG